MSAGPRKPTPPAGVETTSRSCPPDHIHVLPGVRTMLCSRAQARRARSPESCKTTPNFGLFETPTPAGPIVVEFLSTVVRRTHSGWRSSTPRSRGFRRRCVGHTAGGGQVHREAAASAEAHVPRSLARNLAFVRDLSYAGLFAKERDERYARAP
jgi:hypothetical protein